ncbi:hypothetical protein SAMN02799622_01101 [Methylobacterium sp. UNC378MF]|nr:hypothetical protein SAMN02799622_01101 [Methylobacterium sp. UNC378MF]
MFCSGCSGRLALTRTDATPGRRATRASATRAICRPSFRSDRAQDLDDREMSLDEQHAAERIIAIAHLSLPHRPTLLARFCGTRRRWVPARPCPLVGPDVAAGRLACWRRLERPPTELWALHISRRLVSPKEKAFMAHLAAELATNGVHPSTTNGSVMAPASVMAVSHRLG